MKEYFKFKIILWYTILVFSIVVILELLIYYGLRFEMTEEVKEDVNKRVEWIKTYIYNGYKPEEIEKDISKIFVEEGLSEILERTTASNKNYLFCIFGPYKKLKFISPNFINLEDYIDIEKYPEGTVFSVKLKNEKFILKKYTENYSILFGFCLKEIHEIQSELIYIFLISIPFSIILSILCGIFVTNKTLNVIKKIRSTVNKITIKSLGERIPESREKDEIGKLVDTLNVMLERLEKSVKTLQQFSADAAHQLKTPLTIMRNELENILRKEEVNREIALSLEEILKETSKLTDIIKNLLMLSNMESGKIKLSFENINMNSLVEDIFQDAKILAESKKIKMSIINNKNVTISGDKELLKILMWNLIDNSLKYTPENGEISIVLDIENSYNTIIINDTGIGISKEELSKVFDRFYRGEKSIDYYPEGSGLGLSICEWIVKLHNGKIEVKSVENKGTTFKVFLPLISNLTKN
ncbi:hypothetical protein DRQ09_01950 [candidate division KSB1 bacterium]|nr:MAG: hypothetical protein DRQ09_01950 [candidate division KSB1 bacterium]